MRDSRSSSEAGVVIEFNGFEPGFDVFACFGKLAEVFGKERQRFRVAVGAAFFHESRTSFDFPRCARRFGMGLNPFKDFPVAFAGGQLLQKSFGSKTQEPDQVLVRAGIVFVLAVFLGKCRPALVEHPRQNDVVAQTNAKASRRALRQINKERLSFRNFIVLDVSGLKGPRCETKKAPLQAACSKHGPGTSTALYVCS